MDLLVALGLLALAALLAALAPRAVDGWARALDRLLRRGRAWGRWAAGLAIAAFTGEALVALALGVPPPRVHDEWSYLLAGDTFAHGRLANPTHPLWRAFEMVHVLVRPTYASKYPPGQGLALALGELLGAPILGVWISGALFVAAAVWMLHGWLRPPAARVGGWFLVTGIVVATPWSHGYWGGFVPALGGALVLGSVPRLARHPRIGDGLALGTGAALLLWSRPYEGGICGAYALLLLFVLRGRPHGVRAPTEAAGSGRFAPALGAAAACGLLAVGFLVVDDLRVTGDPLLLPYRLHDARFMPTPLFLWQHLRTPTEIAPEPLATFYRTFESHRWRELHTARGWIGYAEDKTSKLAAFYLGPALLLPLVALAWPRGSWAERRRVAPARARAVPSSRIAVLAAAILVAALVASQLIIVPGRPHYVAPGSTALFVLVAAGWRRLRGWRPRGAPFGRRLAALLPLVTLVVLPVRAAGLRPDADDWATRRARIAAELARLPGRQLVLVSYGRAHDAQAEWMANGADLFGAKVLWARALSPAEDCRLLAVERDRRAWLLRVEEELSPPRLAPYPRSLCAASNRTRRPSTDQGSTSSRRSASG